MFSPVQACVRPLLFLLVLLAHVVGFGATTEASPPSSPLLHDGGQARREDCLGQGCRSEGLSKDEAPSLSLLQQKQNAQSLSNARMETKMEAMSNAAVIQSMVQQGRITAKMARGLSNASLLLEAAHSAGLSRWTLVDAEDHISSAVKELRSQRPSSKTGPSLSLLATSAHANPATVTGTVGKIPNEELATALVRADGILGPVAGLVGGEFSGTRSWDTDLNEALDALLLIGKLLKVLPPVAPAGGFLMVGVVLLKAIIPFFADEPPNPFEELYERIMADMHITVNRAVMRAYLKGLSQDALTLAEELEWVPKMLNQKGAEYSSTVSLTYELMAQHDCAGLSYKIRTSWRTGTVTQKAEWAQVILPLAEIVAALQVCLVLNIGSHDPSFKSHTKARLEQLLAKDRFSWGSMFREWLEDWRAANLQRRRAHLGDWTYTHCEAGILWNWHALTTFRGKCHLETNVCKATGCVGEIEGYYDKNKGGIPDNSWWFDTMSLCKQWKLEDKRYIENDPRTLPCHVKHRDLWLESVYDGTAPNQWNAGMANEESHYNKVAGLLVMQVHGQVKLLNEVLADRPPVATGAGQRLGVNESLLGQCQGDCDTDEECQEHLVCKQRQGTSSLPVQCIGDVAADPGLSGVDFCIMPELKHHGWHNVDWTYVPYGDKARNPLQLCEGDCDNDAECAGHLICHQTSSGDTRVPGCWGLPVPEMDYCVHPPRSIVNKGTGAHSQPLGLCEGDCHRDSDCKPGLVCFQRDEETLGNGESEVPGCKGSPDSPLRNYDYCVAP